jgi:6-phosphogluconolactonase/glucosamine-6-phosphate isomerase/deaminase
VEKLRIAIAARGRADFVTTGGSTPIGIYRLLAGPLRGQVDWSLVHFWWGDDRFVPRDHPLSNVLPADAILFAAAAFAGQSGNVTEATDIELGAEPGIVLPVANIHPFPCTAAIAGAWSPDRCAVEYVGELRRAGLRVERGFPVFDLVLLGLGPDGHLLSIFPGSDAWDSSDWALAVPAPTHVEPHVARLTLNPGVLAVAGCVLVVTSGAAKAEIVGRIFTTERDVRRLPAQAVRRTGTTWILDEPAAARLPVGLGSRG